MNGYGGNHGVGRPAVEGRLLNAGVTMPYSGFHRSAHESKRCYGTARVTAVGMFGNKALWFVPLGGATVLVTVGSIVERLMMKDGRPEMCEHLCLTVSFNHDIV